MCLEFLATVGVQLEDVIQPADCDDGRSETRPSAVRVHDVMAALQDEDRRPKAALS